MPGNTYINKNGRPITVLRETSLNVENLKSIMFSIVPSNFIGNYNLYIIMRNTNFTCQISNITVTNGEICNEQPPLAPHQYRLCEGYDDIYNLNPFRLCKEMRKLGYVEWVDLYVGASNFYEKSGIVTHTDVEFQWFAGFAVSQKQKSINALHTEIREKFPDASPLEISTLALMGALIFGAKFALAGLPNVNINGSNLIITLAVILIVLEAINVVSKGLDAWRKLTGKDHRASEISAINADIRDLKARMTSAEHRLQQGNARFDATQNDTTEILLTLKGIIKHLISGNDREKLKTIETNLDKYLIEKRGIDPN